MKETEAEGKTVTMAVESGLDDLGLRRDQVEVEVLQEPSQGFMGFGAKPARVRIREKIWDPSGEAKERPARPEAGPSKAGPPAAAEPPQAARQHRPTLGPRRFGRKDRAQPQARQGPAGPLPSQPAPGQAQPRPEERPEAAGEAGEPRPQPHQEEAQPPREERAREERPRRERPPSHYREGGPRQRHAEARRPAAERPPMVQGPPPEPAKAVAEAKPMLEELLRLLGVEAATVATEWDAKQERVRAEVETPEAQRLIGPGGRVLEALQYLATMMLTRRLKGPVAVQIETAGYWRDKEEGILLQVHQAMEVVKNTDTPVRLQPMDACMRRLVHRTLADHPEIETISEGEGTSRKVVLKPRRKGK